MVTATAWRQAAALEILDQVQIRPSSRVLLIGAGSLAARRPFYSPQHPFSTPEQGVSDSSFRAFYR